MTLDVSMDEGLMWHEGLSVNRIQGALNKFKVDELAQGYYRFEGHNDSDVQLIWESFGINIQKRLYTTGELRTLSSGFKKSSDLCGYIKYHWKLRENNSNTLVLPHPTWGDSNFNCQTWGSL